jgi:hypothetical protein
VSALAWSQVRTWRAGPLEDSGTRLTTTLNRLVGAGDELAAMGRLTGWRGEAADAARCEQKAITDQLEDLVGELSAARAAMFRAADGVLGVQAAVARIEEFAEAQSLVVTDAGVQDTMPLPCFAQPHDSEVALAERARIVQECQARIEEVLATAARVVGELANTLRKLTLDFVDAGRAETLAEAAAIGDAMAGFLVPPAPVGGGTPAQNAGWWDSLSPRQQQWVIANQPRLIANRDGVDFAARDQANRILLPGYQAQLQAREQELLAWQQTASRLIKGEADAELQQIRDKLASLHTVQDILAKEDRQLLGLDITQPRAQAIIAVGDVTTAAHVAVFTPGFTSTVQGIGDYDRDMERLRLQAQADLHRHESADTVATVTWLGYQAPQWDCTLASPLGRDSVVRTDMAEQGGQRLGLFYQGLNASRAGEVDVTALGHSYGSTTTAYALQQVTGADRAAYFGSPGLATTWDQLSMPTHSMYSENAAGDLIYDSKIFGGSPGDMPGVTNLSTEAATAPDGTPLLASHDHSEYLNAQTTSQHNLAAVVAGHPEDAIPAP